MSETNPAPEGAFEIAVVGMAGRFPGASNIEEFWRNLRGGVESVTFFSDEELLEQQVDPALLDSPNFVKANSYLQDAEYFDAGFFGFSPREAEMMDPQNRVFLECAWSALEDAGYDSERFSGLIGVFGGSAISTYALRRPEVVMGGLAFQLANTSDTLCTRVSYKMNMEGPSVTVQSACSTSASAIHIAIQSLLSGDCDMALAGGVRIYFPQKAGYIYTENGIHSPDGHTRSFDANGRGAVFGEGVAIVVLKRLADALADGDAIRAVVKSSALNNDGIHKAGYTAPRVEGQVNVVRSALLSADVDPETISYVECHGTGTPVGDPIEVAGLSQAYREHTAKKNYCAIGSVKSNMGHLDVAAGVTGFIKTVLALEHKEKPPSLHFETPNPEIDFEDSPFFVQTELEPWPEGATPRRAGVNCFGIGGTNCHMILEEAPPAPDSAPSRRPAELVVLSARTPEALDGATANLAERLRRAPLLELPDVAFTLQAGRRGFNERRILVARDRDEAVAILSGQKDGRLLTSSVKLKRPALAFAFPGLGDHYVGMGAELYRTESPYREEIDRCSALLEPYLGLDLRQVLYPDSDPAAPARAPAGEPDLKSMLGRGKRDDEDGPLRETRIAQPAVFVVDYALARLWMSWGLEPQAMIGYSLGEYVAACLAGVLSLEDALKLVAERARLIQGLPEGAMLAVPLSEERVSACLGDSLSLAVMNGETMSVVAGPPEAVDELAERLAGEGQPVRRLRNTHAFHSRMMDPIAEPFGEVVGTVRLRAPQIPYLSNVTGTWIRDEEAASPEYWVDHMCRTVRFADGLGELWEEPERVVLEVGPGQTLGSLALQHPGSAKAAHRVVVASLRHEYDGQSDSAFLMKNLGMLWMSGVDVDWEAFRAGERPRRVPLPTYPFERQRFFLEESGPMPGMGAPQVKIRDMADWFYIPSWKRSRVRSGGLHDGPWLLFMDENELGQRLAERLRAAGRRVIEVWAGSAFDRPSDDRFVIDRTQEKDFQTLLKALGKPPSRIVHLWNLTSGGADLGLESVADAQARGFFTLVLLAQSLGRLSLAETAEILVVANGLCAVEHGDVVHPEKATLLGPMRVMTQEYPTLACRLVDVDPGGSLELILDQLLAELAAPAETAVEEPVVAWRGPHRWAEDFEAVRLEAGEASWSHLESGGVYLISGGLGGLGLGLAEYLATSFQARLVLLGRSDLPPASEWSAHLEDETDVARKIRGIRALEEAGSEVMYLAADVADPEAMRVVAEKVRERFGELDGVFHVAGLPGVGLLQLKTLEAAAEVLSPKVAGTVALVQALRELEPRFLVLYSTLTTLVGGLGQADYAAANAFLDALAQRQTWPGGCEVFTVNWGEWQWDAWTEKALAMDPKVLKELQRERAMFGMHLEEGIEAMRRIMRSGEHQVFVATRPFANFIENAQNLSNVLEALEGVRQSGDRHERPVLGTPFVAPRNDAEARLAGFWQELLGIREIGVHDNFFELGGHSLVGIQLTAQIQEAFDVMLPLRMLFEKPTVAELAEAIEAEAGGAGASDLPEIERTDRSEDVEVALGNIDQLSEEEMDSMLVELLTEEESTV